MIGYGTLRAKRRYGSNRLISVIAKKARQQMTMRGSRAIVPYRMRRAIVRAAPRVAVGGALATTALNMYRNRGRLNLGRAQRITQRMYRKARSGVGERVGSERCRSRNTVVQNATYGTRVLNVTPLIANVSEGTGNDQRMRDLINVRGFKLFTEFIHQSGRLQYLNIAVIHPKQGQVVTVDDFFRENEVDRAVDFTDTFTALSFATRSINTDKFNVLMHKRFRLAPANTTTSGFPNTDNARVLKFYVPLKKQIRYQDNDGVETPIHQLFMVHWSDQFGTISGVASGAAQYQLFERHILYFRNTRD